MNKGYSRVVGASSADILLAHMVAGPALSRCGLLTRFCGRVEARPPDRTSSFYEPLIRLVRRLTPRRNAYLVCPFQAPSTSLLSTVSTETWSTTCTRTERTFSTRKLSKTTKKSWTFLELTLRTRAAGGKRHAQHIYVSRFRHPYLKGGYLAVLVIGNSIAV